ncbi:YutD family protein [Levilactobacillus sp. N40-8-2]|uniref:YutD family protein n=1 Tax=Levilactobacillus muriae TaxID=3238987 RepID=UPI0038B23B16
MTTVDRKDLEALVAEQRESREPAAEVVHEDDTHLTINGHPYEVVANVRDGFDFAEFARRFSTILSKFDYIVGDWGFEQLRLKGFYAEDRAGAKQNQIDAVQDYLYESCNFGCAYFILHNLDVKAAPKPRRSRSRRRSGSKPAQQNQEQSRPQNKQNQPQHQSGDKPTAKATSSNRGGNGHNRNAANTANNKATTNNNSNGNNTGNSTTPNGSHRRRSRHSRHRNNANHPYTEERRTTTQPKPDAGKTVTVATGGQGRRHFTIRQKKEN